MSDNGPWLFAYFRQVYKSRVEETPQGWQHVHLTDRDYKAEQLHGAWSRDALQWTPLNDNAPTWPEQWLRDPFVGRGPDGAFHLLATGGSKRGCLYARSMDLISWQPRVLPLMESVAEAGNVWAPEWFFDHEAGEFLVFWSSSFAEHGWDESRIWCSRTRDFQAFSPPRVLFDPGYTVIDATIVRRGDEFVMFFKDERFGYKHGEHRFVRMATAPHLDGPYQVRGEPLTPQLCEGPSVLDTGKRAFLFFDLCMANGYGALSSRDWTQWQAETAAFPPDARHGSVVAITEAELAALIERFPGSKQP